MTGQERPAWAMRLQTERESRGWGRFAMARRLFAAVGITDLRPNQIKNMARQVLNWEKGQHFPRDWADAYATAYDIPRTDLFPSVPPQSSTGTVNHSTIPDIGDDDVKRRAALQLLATLGVGAGTLGSEPLRQLVDLALTSPPRSLDDWHLACVDHLHALRTRPAAQAREDLVIDLLALGRQLTTADAGDMTELRRVEAALAMLHAHLLTRLGDHGAAIRWWRTARTAADTTGDLDLQLMIRCEEAGVGLYGQRDVRTVLALTHAADRMAGGTPSFWKADLAGTRAKALTLLGQHDQAKQALNDFVGYGGPDARATFFPTLWSLSQAQFAQSWVHAGAGEEAAAGHARELVIARRGDSQYSTNVRLHEALCTVVNGGTDRGMRQAATVLDAIPADYRSQMITEVGHTVLRAVPLDQQNRPAVREFREVLANTAPKPALTAVT